MKLLFPFIIALYCVFSLVLAQDTKCPDQINYPQKLPYCKTRVNNGECKCKNLLPNGECPADTLPNCGVPLRREPNSCKKSYPVNHNKPCKTDPTRKCSEIHYSQNLDNHCDCPIGTKAWPVLTKPWEIKYVFREEYGRYVYIVNGTSPGPTIHAIKGDWVLIPVFNNITKPHGKVFCPEMTTLHWHGVTMRGVERQTPWKKGEPPGFPFMDGVPGVSQCPIPACGRFDYFFQFVDSGTYWYHSHYEIQIADGLSGVMMVKDCKDVDRFKKIYGVTYVEEEDFNDNIINFKDWFNNTTAEEKQKKYMYFPDLNNNSVPREPVPDSGLVNDFTGIPESTNLKIFKFTKDKTYRLRLINTSAMTLFNFSIDDHEFEVVEIEGMIVQRKEKMPNKFTSFNINTGQRVSILVTADQKGEKSAYWMRFYSKGCYNSFKNFLDLRAVVCYDNSTCLPEKKDISGEITCQDTTQDLKPYCGKPHGDPYVLFCDPPSKSICRKYDFKLLIYKYFNSSTGNKFKEAQIDPEDPWEQNILGYLSNSTGISANTYVGHKWSNLQNQSTLLGVLNNVGTKESDNTNAYKLDGINGVYDIIFTNADSLEHPIHLHGHFFYVLAFGDKNINYTEVVNFKDPIQRDVITVPPLGWAHIRFTADNPGVWPLHCHMDWHLGIGMMAQFVELADPIRDTIEPPKAWCSICKNLDEKNYCKTKFPPKI